MRHPPFPRRQSANSSTSSRSSSATGSACSLPSSERQRAFSFRRHLRQEVALEQPKVAAQLPTGGDVSTPCPCVSMALFARRADAARWSHRRKQAAPKDGLRLATTNRTSACRAGFLSPAHRFLDQLNKATYGRKIHDANRPKSWSGEALIGPRNNDDQDNMDDRQRGNSHPKPRLPPQVPERSDSE